jgi:hypothetical protein
MFATICGGAASAPNLLHNARSCVRTYTFNALLLAFRAFTLLTQYYISQPFYLEELFTTQTTIATNAIFTAAFAAALPFAQQGLTTSCNPTHPNGVKS